MTVIRLLTIVMLPYQNLEQSAQVLNDEHLRRNARACRRWATPWAAVVGLYLCAEARHRFGREPQAWPYFQELAVTWRKQRSTYRREIKLPTWMNEEYHAACRSQLIYMDPAWYLDRLPNEDEVYQPVEVPWLVSG